MNKPKPPGYWTIKRIKESRDKFETVRDWYENEFELLAAIKTKDTSRANQKFKRNCSK